MRQRTSTRRVPLIAAAAVAATALVGVGVSAGAAPASASTKAKYGAITIQLSYLKNTEFAGEYEAIERGYFKKAGFGKVTLTAGGGSASAETQVTTGKALIGISSPLITAPAIKKGASVKIIGAEYQKNPFDIVSLKSAPLTKASDLKGKKIAVYSASELNFDAFLKANNLTRSDLTVVPYTDGSSQLASGQVDGYMGFVTSFTGTVGTKNLPAQHFLLADKGLPSASETLMASTSTISSKRAELTAALGAIAKGWKYVLAHNDDATKLTVNKYGKSQDYTYDGQLAALKAQNPLMSTKETDKNGLLTMSSSLQKQTVKTLKLSGIKVSKKQLFDASLIADFYKKNPKLK